MKISIDKSSWGLGAWWLRPDRMLNSDTVLVSIGPIIIRLYHKHHETPVAAQDLQFR